MKKKIQILYIHGGMTFKNQKDYLKYLKTRYVSIEKRIKWNGDYLDKSLGENYQIIRPQMPLQDNAHYKDWEIFFKRFIPYLNNPFILIGNSLGSTFLAKFLSENKLPKKALSVYLVCPPYDNTVIGEDLVNGFKLKSDLSLLEKNTKNLYLMFSEDDDCVPISHAQKYEKKLKNATIFIYKSKNGHFLVPTFPEIVQQIKSDVKNK